jgi:hypothetical protein
VNGSVPELDKPISWEEVHSGTLRLTASSAAGLDGVQVRMLQNMGIAAEMALVSLFNMIWTTLKWPDEWQRAYLLPLLKGDGSALDPSNYRLLSIGSTASVPKLFEKILEDRISGWAERVGLVSDLQGGFRGWSKHGRPTLLPSGDFCYAL